MAARTARSAAISDSTDGGHSSGGPVNLVLNWAVAVVLVLIGIKATSRIADAATSRTHPAEHSLQPPLTGTEPDVEALVERLVTADRSAASRLPLTVEENPDAAGRNRS